MLAAIIRPGPGPRTAAPTPAPSYTAPRPAPPPAAPAAGHLPDDLPDHLRDIQPPGQHERREQGMTHLAGPAPDLGTKIFTQMPESRTYRRYPDQNTIGTAHDGQSGRGNSTSRPAAAYTPAGSGHGHTMDTGDTPPRIPPRHRDQTMRGGLPHVPGDIIARREPRAADITKDRGRTPSQDAQVIRPSTAP